MKTHQIATPSVMRTMTAVVLSALIWSCDVPIDLDLEQTQPKYVIDGQLIFDENLNPHQQYVRVSQSVGFYESRDKAGVSGAEVYILDDKDTVRFEEHTLADSSGYYFPETPFVGTTDREYVLRVNVNGEGIVARDRLPALNATIDSLSWAYNEDYAQEQRDNPDNFDEDEIGVVYETFLFSTIDKNDDPQDVQNFLFKFYVNDTLETYDGQEVYFADDALVRESINGIATAPWYRWGDLSRVEVLSISRDAFVFYSDLTNNINSDGGMFGPIPANLRTNLEGDALGFFQTSMIKSDTITVGRP